MDRYVFVTGYDVPSDFRNPSDPIDELKVIREEKVFRTAKHEPAIHNTMTSNVLPVAYSSDASDPVRLVKKRYNASDLQNLAGTITHLFVPKGWLVRCWSGRNFDGVMTEYSASTTPNNNKQAVGKALIFSLELVAIAPMLLSTPTSKNERHISTLTSTQSTVYLSDDLDNGIFYASKPRRFDDGATEVGSYEKAGIQSVWVPDGFVVYLYSRDVPSLKLPMSKVEAGVEVQTIYGNQATAWVQVRPGLRVLCVHSVVAQPMLYREMNRSGIPQTLPLGDTKLPSSFKPKALFVPEGTKVTNGGRQTPLNTTTRLPSTLDNKYTMSIVYREVTNSETVDNLPVQTKYFISKSDFAKDCEKECSKTPECVAYYAHILKHECPNPLANNGEDPEVNGCKAVCGLYEVSDSEARQAMRTAQTTNLPGFFAKRDNPGMQSSKTMGPGGAAGPKPSGQAGTLYAKVVPT